MMKLNLCKEAMDKLNALRGADDRILIDLDDGVGPYSTVLMENGLKYRLLVVPAASLPATYHNQLRTNVGTIYFDDATARYLDPIMTLRFVPERDELQLWSDAGLLEPDLSIMKATPQKARMR